MKKILLLASTLIASPTFAALPDCYIYGDSIAQGVSQYLPHCRSNTQVGISSKGAMDKFGFETKAKEKAVIVSLGSNDSNPKQTVSILRDIITRAHASGAQKVFLILPAEQGRHDTIKKSLEGRATLLPIRKLSTDNIHPTEKGYQDLANQVKKS
ncbi:SGNH/GDSL hydrolase family protein [Burkholderia cenocepacia]|uniref:SGNH/GDSL hydrolase family protein n=1 Tax=Burkholderia cenocepacia TaxID=95486 RepID=UPI002231C935|nr:SGNH/GDSL hydrolase family protein [Burkholderia cenocepacia]MCW3498663.1 SGNH/GDSL hydrolase family protein [Burkholderia cenocepacia]MCW3506249.1 SGNH/GDSL hydrolase family protein [Burkholderia cenocepacia]MCW3513816.1 SGNH/GDSL hydrolase family protein [Burkholderia cenocepacia]MCW3528966.1 SGNH/GDSL hydrolase family protein [Burkholderia cenocepacia]MCW3544700.1 SGNH/GDSL hydrolase family protein [Burkholderia cenocepacia]